MLFLHFFLNFCMTENLSAVFILGILLSCGFLLGIVARKIGLPRIVAYICVGVLFSPDLLGGVLNFSAESWAPLLTDVALAIIAYLVGSEISLRELQKEERTVISAVLGQSLGVLLFISLGLWGLSQLITDLPGITFYEALIFGAVATATAPATSIGIIEEYKARGKLTNTLLGVIAVDDAIGIVFFTLVLGMGGESSLGASLLGGLRELAGALVTGGVLGAVLGLLGKYINKEDLRLPMIIGFVFLVFGISKMFDFSILLSCMTLGLVSEILYPRKQAEWLLPMQHIEELVFLFFFTLAGIKFELNVFMVSSVLILIYIILRTVGKYTGAYAAMTVVGTPKSTKKLLGLCLFPQAGVAIGLAILASHQPGLENTGKLLLNVVIGSTIVFELLSPMITRYALRKAGDIDTEDKTGKDDSVDKHS